MPATACASLLVIAGFSTSAGAACFEYRYAGKISTKSTYWTGVEGRITPLTNESISGTASHLLDWVGLNQLSIPCRTTYCWIQDGNMLGAVGSGGAHDCRTSSLSIYMEENDYFDYDCQTYPNLALNNTDYFTDFHVTCNGFDVAQTDAYAFDGTTWVHVGTAYLPYCGVDARAAAITEFAQADPTDACPSITKTHPEYFGSNTGPLNVSPNGATWEYWTNYTPTYNTGYGTLPNTPLKQTMLSGTHEFKTWG